MESPAATRYKEKSVIIHRDENGFGLRVGGQNPVFVDCVHDNGAAWKAGVRKDDRIIKVNGTLVRSYDHQRVVHMIQNCTPFVNLTLHSPEQVVPEPFAANPSESQSTEPNTSGLILGSNSNNNNSTSNNANNSLTSTSMNSLHQRLHNPHSVASSNSNWLLNIADDLFQDNQFNKPQQQAPPVNPDTIQVNSTTHQVGVSKLGSISGPSPLITSLPQLGSGGVGKPKLRHNRNQASSRDNPYYYYKTAPDKAQETNSNSSANSSLLSQDPGSSKTSTLSIVRSRSSSKMSIRSTSGKHKGKNLRSRLVDDLRSLTINNFATSLSTSPSSSDLSDVCDDPDSNSSASGINLTMSANANSSGLSQDSFTKPRPTTRRIEIIRELVETEKTHTERLKQLNDLVYKPLKKENYVPLKELKMVFSCHKTLFKIHRQIYKILSTAQLNISEYNQEPLVGKALVEIFEGELGKRLEKAASTFCACQSTNTELLNRVTRRDTKSGDFLAHIASQHLLCRLGIKDLLASCFQRLTKYPLLLDNLLKATPTVTCGIHSKSLSEGSIATSLASIVNSTTDVLNANDSGFNTNDLITATDKSTSITPSPSLPTPASIIISNNNEDSTTSVATTASTMDDEYARERAYISLALHQSRQILIHVNEAVKRAVSQSKMRDIWKKTDKHPALPVIDIETQQMLHDGPLTLRLARRSFEVYVLLLTNYLVILSREGQDKYKLKYFTADVKLPANQFSPIFNIDEHLATRDTATDENGFYLLCKRKKDSRIFEFASQSPVERAKWMEKIHMAQLYANPKE